ncbi:MAG TPA: DUF1178 family protein [Burkholderiales bacterium]
MIVFNLSCAADHRFEGWFASGEDFDAQRGRGLLSCPLCGSSEVSKQLSAPRLNLHAQPEPKRNKPAREGAPVPAAQGEGGAAKPVAMLSQQQQDALRALIGEVLANTEDVGDRFAEEARRIHYKETEARAIRGVASREEAEALVDEGIEVAQLPVAIVDKSRLN